MASRGRKPKPPELKILTGNPGRRPIGDAVGIEFSGALVLPSWLDEKSPVWKGDFLGEWNRLTRQLETWGIVGEVNQGAVEGLCSLYANHLKAVRGDDSVEARQSYEAYRKALSEFGLTPASKSKSGAKPSRKADPSERFFGAG